MKIFVLLLFLLNSLVFAKVQLELTSPSQDIKQGEIISGKLFLKDGEGQVSLSGLKGKSIGETIYFVSVNPLIGKNGVLESEVRFIFLAIPQSNLLNERIDGDDFTISWVKFNVIPTQPVESFLLGDFVIPERKKILRWFMIGFLFLAAISCATWFYFKFKKKKKIKIKLQELKEELINCKNYDDIVLLWQNKRKFIQHFPHIDKEFKALEVILFKYQFKPKRTEEEVSKVVTAYLKFKDAVSGSLNGI
jgi:hypothetical protein